MNNSLLDALNLYLAGPKIALLFAKAGFGKTWIALNLFTQKQRSIVLVSPLRSILLELRDQLSQGPLFDDLYYFENKENVKLLVPNILGQTKAKIVLSTPELLTEEIVVLLEEKKYIFVLDEIHLFFYWGQSFRPCLWDFLLSTLTMKTPALLMTATFSESIKPELFKLLELSSKESLHLNLGHGVQYQPKKSHFFPHGLDAQLPLMIDHLLRKKLAPILIFCPFRDQVDELTKILQLNTINVLECKGGESLLFYEKLQKNPNPQVIIATSVLSHGVNLPEIRSIFILYQEVNLDIRQQMIGRGGRKGSDFFVYELNPAFYSINQRLLSYLQILAILNWEKIFYGLTIRWPRFIKNALSGKASANQSPT